MMQVGVITDGEKAAFLCYKKTEEEFKKNSEYFIFYFLVLEKLIRTIYKREGMENKLTYPNPKPDGKPKDLDTTISKLIFELEQIKDENGSVKFKLNGLHDFKDARNSFVHDLQIPETEKLTIYKTTAENFKNQYITVYGLQETYNNITIKQPLDLVSYANEELSTYNSEEDNEINDRLKAYIQSLLIPSGIEVVNAVNIQKVKNNISADDLKSIKEYYYLKCKNDSETLKKIVYSESHYSMSFNRGLKDKNEDDNELRIKIEDCIKLAKNHQLSLIKILGYPGSGKSTYLWSMAKHFSTEYHSIIINNISDAEKICKYIFETLDKDKTFLLFIDEFSKKEKIIDFVNNINTYNSSCKIVVILADRTSQINNFFSTAQGKEVERIFSNKYYQFYFPSQHAFSFAFEKILIINGLKPSNFEGSKKDYTKIDTPKKDFFGFYDKTELLLRSLGQQGKFSYATDKEDWKKIAVENNIPNSDQIFNVIAILQNDDRDTPLVFFEKYIKDFNAITFNDALVNNAGKQSPVKEVFPDYYNLRNTYICNDIVNQLTKSRLIGKYYAQIIECLLKNLDDPKLLGLFKELMRKDEWYNKIVAANGVAQILQSHIDKNDNRKPEYAILLHKVLQQKYETGTIGFQDYIQPLLYINNNQKVYTRLAFAYDKEDPTEAIVYHNKALKLDPDNSYSLWGKFRSYIKFLQLTQKPSDEFNAFLQELANKSKEDKNFAYTFLQNIIKSNAPIDTIVNELIAIFNNFPSLHSTILNLFINRKLGNTHIKRLSEVIINRLLSTEENTISYITNNLKLLTKLSRSLRGNNHTTINEGLNNIYEKLSTDSIQSPTIDNLYASYLLHTGQYEIAKEVFKYSGDDIKHIFNIIKCYNSELAYSYSESILNDVVSYIDTAITNFTKTEKKENVVKLQLEKYLLYDTIKNEEFKKNTPDIKENLLKEIEKSIDDTLKKDETIWIRFLIYKYNFYAYIKHSETTVLENLFDVISEENKNKKHNTKLRKLYVEAFLNHKDKAIVEKFLFIKDISLDTNDIYDSVEIIKDCISFLNENNSLKERKIPNFYKNRDAAKEHLIEQIKKYKGTIGSNTKEKNNLATIFMYAEEWQDVDQNLELENINNYTLQNIPFVNTILNYIEKRTKYLLKTKKDRYNRILELISLIKILEDNRVVIKDYTSYRTFAWLYYLLDDQENTKKYFQKFFEKIKKDKNYNKSYADFCNNLLRVKFELFQAKYAYKTERFSKNELYSCLEKLHPIIQPISDNIYKELNVGIGNQNYDTNRDISIFVYEIFKRLKGIYEPLISKTNGFVKYIDDNMDYFQRIFDINNTLYDRYTFDFLLFLFKDKKYTNSKKEIKLLHNRPEVKKIIEYFVSKYKNTEDCEINRFIAKYYLDIKEYTNAEIFNDKSFKNIDEKHDKRFLSYSNFNKYEIIYNKIKESNNIYTLANINDLLEAQKCLTISHDIYISEVNSNDENNNKDKKIKGITDRYNKNFEEIEELKYTITKALYNKLMDALFKSDILNKDTLTEIEKIEKILKEQQELSLKYDKEQTAAITKVVETITHLKTLCKNIFFKNNKPQNHTLNTKKGINTFVGLIFSQLKIFNSKELDQILKSKINKKLTAEINKYKTKKESLGGTLE